MNSFIQNFKEPYPGWLHEAVTSEEASRILSIPTESLATLRSRGGGPRFFNPPGTRYVRYLRIELYLWLFSGGLKANTSDPGKEISLEILSRESDGSADEFEPRQPHTTRNNKTAPEAQEAPQSQASSLDMQHPTDHQTHPVEPIINSFHRPKNWNGR